MLDGGIVDSIPVEYALSQGYDKAVVILTRNKGYRKKDSRMPLAKVVYKNTPPNSAPSTRKATTLRSRLLLRHSTSALHQP